MADNSAFTSLTKGDLQLVVARLPRDLMNIMREQPIFVGGGFIRETIAGNPPQDIDLFGPNIEVLKASAEFLRTKREGGRIHNSDNAITLLSLSRLPVQFITRWLFDEPDALVASFDFTICQAVIYFNRKIMQWASVAAVGFYPDLAARRLVYTSPVRDEEAGGSILRVRKFLMRGYNIQAYALAGVIARVALSARLTVETTEQDAAFAISRKLVEIDPLLLIDGFEPVDEHEVITGLDL